MEKPEAANCLYCGDVILMFENDAWIHGRTLDRSCHVWQQGDDVPNAAPRLYVIQEETLG